ncbi:MAG: 16S rRNA (uracil(1498)-N(3))-methyltransferase [Lachnospiraceae bacterium]|nr:16S rRNA (uracil(1498)-N(3))-methyltransferase [Lachnospiraceae bacterium]
MYHFFVEGQVNGDQVVITGSDVNHIKNVLRMRPGEEIKISDGGNMVYLSKIVALEEEQVICEVQRKEESYTELPCPIYLFQGLPKSDKMELIIQKAVELGVSAIIPMSTNRAVVKLDAKKEENKRKRWNSIAESAAKQSGRSRIPKVEPAVSFKEAAERMQTLTHRFIPYELCEGMEETRRLLGMIRPGDSIGIMIGPEGGFEKEEISLALKHDILPITLGGRILRTETAGMSLLSILMFLLDS